jgi:hypothetical protein
LPAHTARRYAAPVIVVIGHLLYRETDRGGLSDGTAARIAIAAAAAPRSVQLVGKVGEDPEGNAVLLALARGGVGHVAVLRDAGMATPRAMELIDPDLDGSASDPASKPAAHEGTASSAGIPALDAADVDLALRYLTDFSVLVLCMRADEAITRVAAAAADWADARLIVVVPAGGPIPDGLPPDAIAFEAPEVDPDGVFAGMVGAFAAALDDGSDPATAFESSVVEAGWQPSADA